MNKKHLDIMIYNYFGKFFVINYFYLSNSKQTFLNFISFLKELFLCKFIFCFIEIEK